MRCEAPKGVKGIEALTEEWGQVLLKVHQEDQPGLMDSLFFACSNLEDYQKAFHLFLQFFYHFDILDKEEIIAWVKGNESEAPTLTLVQIH
jgi:hypothetical protein